MRHGKFCPKCGRETEELHGGLCSDCFAKKMELPKSIPEKIVINTCKSCGRVFLKDKKYESPEIAIESFLEKTLDEQNVKSATYRISGSTLFVTASIETEGVKKEIEKVIPLVHKTITCEFCNLKKSKYYNVTIQVRVPKKMIETIIRDIENEIAKLNETDNYAFISGRKDLKEGVDIFIGSKSAANHVVKYLKSKYHIKTKISRTLFGPIQGKKVYRDTILVSIGE